LKLSELFAGALAQDLGDIDVAGLTADSRRVAPGFLFAALAGAGAHGRDYVEAARQAGAAAILSAGDLLGDPGLPHVIAPAPRRALALAAAKFYARRPETLVAVTGTNGKSSTVDFLRQIWWALGIRSASVGTLGVIGPEGARALAHTTPDPVVLHEALAGLAQEGVTHAALEASSHGLVQHRLDGLRFKAGAFTNLTQDHLDYHETMDAYRAAKLALWDLIEEGGLAVVNADAADAPFFEKRALERGLALMLCGWRAPRAGSLKIVEIQPRPNAQTLTLLHAGVEADVELPLIGEFQALNAVCAGALALGLGAPRADVFAAMAQLKPVKGRMEHIGETRAGAHVFVDFAHTPDGLDALLRAARPHAAGRLVIVFGAGGDRDAGKRAKMGAKAAQLADIVIVSDDNPRSEDPAAIRAQILKGAPGATEIGERGDAIRRAIAMLAAGDALLIAGKGHETGQIIKGEVHPFSDQDVARQALEGAQ